MTYHRSIIDKDWTILLVGQAKKFRRNLPENTQLQLLALVRSLSKIGPIQHKWPHYSKFRDKVNVHSMLST